jgi:hypothetical protein
MDGLLIGAIDVVRIEIVPFNARKPKPPEVIPPQDRESLGGVASSDSRHAADDAISALSSSTKSPILRRSALHFLTLLLNDIVQIGYDQAEGASSSQSLSDLSSLTIPDQSGERVAISSEYFYFDDDLLRRLGIVVRYAKEVDVDGIVRSQASEVEELLDRIAALRMGFS